MKPTLLSILLLAACGGPPPGSAPEGSKIPDSFWLATAPEGARTPLELRAEARDGDRVLLVGRVGGKTEAFLQDRAVFSVVDASLQDCTAEGDGCPTPWDYCCVEPERIQSASVVVELRGPEGTVRTSARGFHGLDHGRTVVAEGTLTKDAQGNLHLAAERIHVR
jgi:hypothetical protein